MQLKPCPFCGSRPMCGENPAALMPAIVWCDNIECPAKPHVGRHTFDEAAHGWNTRAALASQPEAGAGPEWLWYGEDEHFKPHVSMGRWKRHPCQVRYKLADIQPTEHDHPAAPAPSWMGKAVEALKRAEKVLVTLDKRRHDLNPYSVAGTIGDIREALSALKAEEAGS